MESSDGRIRRLLYIMVEIFQNSVFILIYRGNVTEFRGIVEQSQLWSIL
jgi:hypothetical protein